MTEILRERPAITFTASKNFEAAELAQDLLDRAVPSVFIDLTHADSSDESDVAGINDQHSNESLKQDVRQRAERRYNTRTKRKERSDPNKVATPQGSPRPSKKSKLGRVPVSEKQPTQRQLLHQRIASDTTEKRHAWLRANKAAFLPLLPEQNFVKTLADRPQPANNRRVMQTVELSKQPTG